MRLPTDGRWLGDRVTLRQLGPLDAPSVLEALNADGFADGMLQDPPETLTAVEEALAVDRQRWVEGASFAFAVTRGDGFVGRADLRPDPHVPGALNLGFWIVRARWGQGLASDAANVALRIAFLDLGVAEVWAGAATWNAASHKVLNRLMVHREHRKQGFLKHGTWVANERYSLSSQQWLQRADSTEGSP